MAKAKSDETHQFRFDNKFSSEASLNARASNLLTSIPSPQATSFASLRTRALNAEISAYLILAGVISSSFFFRQIGCQGYFVAIHFASCCEFCPPSISRGGHPECFAVFVYLLFLPLFCVRSFIRFSVSHKHDWCHTFVPIYAVSQWVMGQENSTRLNVSFFHLEEGLRHNLVFQLIEMCIDGIGISKVLDAYAWRHCTVSKQCTKKLNRHTR